MKSIRDPKTEVLIVDDNTQYSQILTRMLRHGFGYNNITTVESIEDGYHLIANQPDRFGMLFCDFHFPSGVTGGELLRRLSNEQRLQNVVAFLITSEPTVDNVKEARQAGAVGVVAKPFDRDELERQLDKAERNFQLNEGESF